MSTAVPSRALAPLRRASPSSSSLEKAAAKSRKNACGARREAGRRAWAGSSVHGELLALSATQPPRRLHASMRRLTSSSLAYCCTYGLNFLQRHIQEGKGLSWLAVAPLPALPLPQHTGTHLSHSSHMSVLSIINWPLLSSYCRREREGGQQEGGAVRRGPPARAAACAQPGC